LVNKEFFSNGKLLISGEYFVLHGAMALAVPVRFGQSLSISSLEGSKADVLTWVAREKGREWFRAVFQGRDFQTKSAHSRDGAYLQKLLETVSRLNPLFAEMALGSAVITNTGFPLEWGLGSSSTLVSNLAAWASVDPYQLHFLTSNGSGYDIACARSQVPVLYRFNGRDSSPTVQPVSFNPPFAENLWLVFSGRKQSSAQSIENLNPAPFSRERIAKITALTFKMQSETSLELFMKHMKSHNQIVSETIGKIPVQEERFQDFPGTIKSLGAWGGDFLLAATDVDELLVKHYFLRKGCPVIIHFKDMMLNP